jgi:RimJ/RimL family protein N-acetyltransferase
VGIEPFLTTSHRGVALRRLSAADLPAFQAYRTDPLLARYQGWSAMSDMEAREFLVRMSTADLFQPGVWSQVGIADAGDSTLFGDIGLFLAADGQQAQIGITLARISQGRGIGTAATRQAIGLAFEQTTAGSVVGIVDARNEPSVRLLQRVGMRLVESRSVLFRNEPCVEHIYAISRQNDG